MQSELLLAYRLQVCMNDLTFLDCSPCYSFPYDHWANKKLIELPIALYE